MIVTVKEDILFPWDHKFQMIKSIRHQPSRSRKPATLIKVFPVVCLYVQTTPVTILAKFNRQRTDGIVGYTITDGFDEDISPVSSDHVPGLTVLPLLRETTLANRYRDCSRLQDDVTKLTDERELELPFHPETLMAITNHGVRQSIPCIFATGYPTCVAIRRQTPLTNCLSGVCIRKNVLSTSRTSKLRS